MDYDDPRQITEEMRGGIARAYADQGFRSYIVNAINICNHNIIECIKKDDMDNAKMYTTRLQTLKTLLDKGKMVFETSKKKQVEEPLLALDNLKHEE